MTATPLALETSRAGVVVPVHARPRGRRDAVVGVRAGALLVETVAAPEDGAANEAIRRVLAAALAVGRAAVALTTGAASRHKRFCIAGLDAVTVARRLADVLEDPSPSGGRGGGNDHSA